MKNLLITHTDLDGISPIILMNLTEEEFTYKSIEINEVEETFNELIENDLTKYENVYVTDLTIPESIYEKINELNLTNIKVFDHHETHLYANKENYTEIKCELNGRPTCGTELFYEYLKTIHKELDKNIIKEYVELVRQLDTYTFINDIPKQLDLLKDTFGKLEFIKTITKRLKKDKEEFTFTTFEKRFLKLRQNEVERYLQKMEKKMKLYEINNKKCGVVFAETNKSALGNYLSNKYPELDLIILIDASSRISYRTSRDDVRVNDFASIYTGGGHPKASGSKFDDQDREKIVEYYFKNIKRLEDKEN